MMSEVGRCGKNLIIRVRIMDESGRQQRNYVLRHGLESPSHEAVLITFTQSHAIFPSHEYSIPG